MRQQKSAEKVRKKTSKKMKKLLAVSRFFRYALAMQAQDFNNWMKENELQGEAFDLGYAEGVAVYWNEEEGKGNVYEANTLNWFLFEEGKAQAGQDL
jgi:hypothetical protein